MLHSPQNVGSESSTKGPRGIGYCIWKWACTAVARTAAAAMKGRIIFTMIEEARLARKNSKPASSSFNLLLLVFKVEVRKSFSHLFVLVSEPVPRLFDQDR